MCLVAAVHTLDHDDGRRFTAGQALLRQFVFQLPLREHARVLAVEVQLGLPFVATHGQHDHAMRDGLLLAGLVDDGLEVADVASDLHRLGLQVQGDLRVLLHASDQLGEVARDIGAFQGEVNVAQLPAQHGFLFAQMYAESLIAERQRRGHAGQAAAKHQRRLHHRQLARAQRLEIPRARHGHAHEVGGLLGRRHGIIAMHPRTLVADVGHGEEVLIEARLAQGLLEKRFVGARRARCDHEAIQALLADHVLDVLLAGVRAGIEVGLRVRDAGHFARRFRDRFHVDHGGDVVAAVTDEDADARFLVGDVALPRVFVALDHGAAHRGQLLHRARGRARGLRHGLGNVLGLLEGAGHVDAGLGRCHGRQAIGSAEAELVQVEAQLGRGFLDRGARTQTDREHNQVIFVLVFFAFLVEKAHAGVLRAGHFYHPRRHGADVLHAVLVARAVDVAVELLAEGAHVHAEDGDIQPLHVLERDHGFLGRGHAADRRAIAVATRAVA